MSTTTYNWMDDIYDMTDLEEIECWGWEHDDTDEAFYAAGETIAREEGGDAGTAAADVINLWFISDRSKLSHYLDMWHELHGTDTMDIVRDYTDFRHGFLFVTGCNYDIMSHDLLGRYYDTIRATKSVFSRFVDAMEAIGSSSLPRYMRLPLAAREKAVIDNLRDVKCLQSVDTGHAVVQFIAENGSDFCASYDPKARSWTIC